MLQKMSVGEIFQAIGKAKSRDEVIGLLRAYNNTYFREYLKVMFGPVEELDFPGLPAYTPSVMPEGMSETNLFHEARRLYIFNKKQNVGIKEIHKCRALQTMLAGLNKIDVDFVVNLLQGKACPETLTIDIVDEVFPGLIAPDRFFRPSKVVEVVVEPEAEVVPEKPKKVKKSAAKK